MIYQNHLLIVMVQYALMIVNGMKNLAIKSMMMENFISDSNLNSKYDFEEEFLDMNENGVFDAQPKNDIKVLLNYKKISELIDDPYENQNFIMLLLKHYLLKFRV